MKMEQVKVKARSRKLKATWTMEMEDKVSLFHNSDDDSWLTKLIADEIDAEIVKEVCAKAKKERQYNRNGANEVASISEGANE